MFVRTTLAVIAAALIIKAGTAFGQVPPAAPPAAAPPAVGAPEHRHHGFRALLRSLNLSPDQNTKIQSIFQKYHQQNANVTDRTQLRASRKAERAEIMAVLTPAQQQQLQADFQKMRERYRSRETNEGPENPTK